MLAQGLALIDSGESLLLRITPEPEPPQAGKLVVHNACLSGGTLEIFLEPVLPAPRLVVFGDAPVARSLRALAIAPRMGRSAADVDLTSVVTRPGSEPTCRRWSSPATAATRRSRSTAALRAGVPYVGLVASRKRGEAVLASLDVDGC